MSLWDKTPRHVLNTYRPVYSLILGSQVMIVLSSDTVIKDLLDKRSAIYSSRPDSHILSILKGGMEFSLMVRTVPHLCVQPIWLTRSYP